MFQEVGQRSIHFFDLVWSRGSPLIPRPHVLTSGSIFTFFALFLQTVSLWRSRREEASPPLHEKNGIPSQAPNTNGVPSQVPNTSAEGGTGAFEEPTATAEGTV